MCFNSIDEGIDIANKIDYKMHQMTFLEKLLAAAKKNKSWLCIGLDPVPQSMPPVDLLYFNKSIVEYTSDLVCAYKPNLAFYEAMGLEGMKALEKTLEYIPDDIPVIGDAKRGDVGHTSDCYARALFDVWGFDGATVNPYFGQDSLEPFFAYKEKGIFILCKTSNPGSADFQDILCKQSVNKEKSAPLWELIARRTQEWNKAGNLGLVAGATYPEQLRRLRKLCPDMPFLIPGVGTQGGDLEKAVSYGSDIRGEMAIVSISRAIIYTSKDRDFALAARDSAARWRRKIDEILISIKR